jgi:phosphatidylglycerophosphatase A
MVVLDTSIFETQMNPEAKTVFTRIDYLIAYGFGSGLAPRAPGTAGSLLALLLFVPVLWLPLMFQVALILVTLVLGTFISGKVARDLELKDPSGIVIDEFVGMWIALLFLPGLIWLVPAFLLFRLFDIAKPWPVGLIDRKLEGGPGIMLDDVAAGLYALGVLQAAHYIVQQVMQ